MVTDRPKCKHSVTQGCNAHCSSVFNIESCKEIGHFTPKYRRYTLWAPHSSITSPHTAPQFGLLICIGQVFSAQGCMMKETPGMQNSRCLSSRPPYLLTGSTESSLRFRVSAKAAGSLWNAFSWQRGPCRS